VSLKTVLNSCVVSRGACFCVFLNGFLGGMYYLLEIQGNSASVNIIDVILPSYLDRRYDIEEVMRVGRIGICGSKHQA
jgi:hypothetical protein